MDFDNERYFARVVEYLSTNIIRLIPQGTVDNNLGPDRLASPKARKLQKLQKINPLIARPLSGSPNCFGPRHSPYSYY